MARAQLAKLTPPHLGRVYLRTRLFERLDAATQAHPVIWIGAPAGAGKTTLVASYFQEQGVKPLWYSVDEGDADPASFFFHLGLAARQAGLRKAPPLFTSEYRLGLPAFSRTYFRNLFARLKKPAVLVVDNVQDAGEASPLNEIFRYGLEETLPDVWIVLISRAQPPAEFARLEAGNAMARLDWNDLRLDEKESQTLIATLNDGDRPNHEQVRRLIERTHGWITGIVLALRTNLLATADVADAPTPGDLNYQEQTFDYFATQVLARTDTGTREFLYTVALLPTMTGSLCQALTGNPDAKAILQHLHRNNFFTSRRGLLNTVYEFHPLFRQFLRARAEDHFPADRLHALKTGTADLLLQAGEPESAAHLLMETGQWDALSDVVKQHARQLVKQSRNGVLEEWITALPEAVRAQDAWIGYWLAVARLSRDPYSAYSLFADAYVEFLQLDNALGMYHAWVGVAECVYFHSDRERPGRYWIEELEKLRRAHPKCPSIELRGKMTTLAFHLSMWTYPENPRFETLHKSAKNMFRFMPVKDVRCFIGCLLSWYYSTWGYIDRLTVIANDLQSLLRSPSVSPFARLQSYLVILLEAWQTGRREDAYCAIKSGLELTNDTGLYYVASLFCSNACMVYLSFGDTEKAEELLKLSADNASPLNQMEVANLAWRRGWLAALGNRFDLAKADYLEFDELTDALGASFIRSLASSGLAQICTELGELDEARRYLDRTHQFAKTMGSPLLREFWCNCLEAYWHDRQGDTVAALAALDKGFSAGQKYNWTGYSFWVPKMVKRLCVLALQHNIEPDYVKRLIATYRYTPPEQQSPIEQWPYAVKVYTLGRFSLLIDDQPIVLSGKSAARPLELLKCLIALGGRNISQDALIQELWPELDGDAGAKAFHTALYRLRKLVGHEDALILKDGLLSLDNRHVWVDVWTFERALSRLDQALIQASVPDDMDALSQQVLQRYQGSFLAQDKEPAWALGYREKLHLRKLRTLGTLGQYWQQRGQIERAQGIFERILELDRLNEPAYQRLMQLYLQESRLAEAAVTYERCRSALSKGLGVMPSPETTALYRRTTTLDSIAQ